MKKVKVLEPDNKFRLIWDFIIVIILLWNIYYVPLSIAFDESFHNKDFDAFVQKHNIFFTVMPGLSLFIDILLSFNTGFYKEGNYVNDRGEIAAYYIKHLFAYDALGFITFFVSYLENVSYLNIIIMFRIGKIAIILKKIEDQLSLKGILKAIY